MISGGARQGRGDNLGDRKRLGRRAPDGRYDQAVNIAEQRGRIVPTGPGDAGRGIEHRLAEARTKDAGGGVLAAVAIYVA